MMLPFALTLYHDSLAEMISARCPDLTEWMHEKYANQYAYQILAGTLRRAVASKLELEVESKGKLMGALLRQKLKGCPAVREIRSFGLLTGIELSIKGFPNRLMIKRIVSLYLLQMLKHRRFPLLTGYCQYEPHVLKLTPPLSVTEAEIHSITDTISDVLHASLWKLAVTGAAAALSANSAKAMS